MFYDYKGEMPENYTLTIKDGTLGITQESTYGCNKQLVAVKIPSSVKYIARRSFPDCKNFDVYSDIAEPTPISEDAFEASIYDNHVLYVPEGTKRLYENTEGWSKFQYIEELATRLVPASTEQTTSYMSTKFKKIVNSSTDLKNLIVDNMYINIDNAAGEGYYTSIGLSECLLRIDKTTSEEEIEVAVNSEIGSKELSDNFTGIILMVNGTGNIKVNTMAHYAGTSSLAIKVGNKEPKFFRQLTEEDVVVPYNVTEGTYVYIYAANINENKQNSIDNCNGVSVTAEAGPVFIYSIDVIPNVTAIENVSATIPSTVYGKIYSIDGKQLSQPQKGLNILKMSDGTTRKVVK